MNNKIKILIAGLGGVGGYFGGHLAQKYAENNAIAIFFLARGEHLSQIKKQGLKVIQGENQFLAKPSLATDNPSEIGFVDYIIIACKSYDLDSILEQLKPTISPNTILLPLLNGVDAVQRIRKVYPNNAILEGCVYIIARLKEAGVIENLGNIQTFYFGKEGNIDEKLVILEKILIDAGIEAKVSDTIRTIIWEKYIFISPTATATSYFDLNMGALLVQEEETVRQLISELSAIALANGISIDSEVADKIIKRLQAMPSEATSSMHSDYKNGKSQTEIEALTGFVVREGIKCKIPTPTYSRIYSEMKNRNPII